MIRGFYSASSGLKSQQQKLNTVANNMANVGTTAFKADNTQFSALIYKNVNGALPPISTGHGVRPVDNAKDFAQSGFSRTDRDTDFAIRGNAFFAVEDDLTGEIYFTRDGNFQYHVEEDEDGKYLINSKGYYVLDVDGERINIEERMEDLDEGEFFSLEKTIGLYQFANVYGLESIGGNLYKETEISGENIPFVLEDYDYDDYEDGQAPEIPEIISGFLENSNVDVAEQMVKMIEASRAFSFNARVISTVDELEQTMNQMR